MLFRDGSAFQHGMFYLATIVHSARQCPGVESETFKEFVRKFSAAELKKAQIRFLGAYIDHSCVTGKIGKEHITTFALEAESITKVEEAFGPMAADIRQVVSWNSFTRITK
jgi:hypothetical protein